MELIIVKNGHVFARARDDENGSTADYTLSVVADADMPVYPTASAGTGKYYELDYVDGVLAWITKDRPLTTEERVEKMENDLLTVTKAWKTGEAVVVGDERYYNGEWYVCIQAHTTQAEWTPDIVPALWGLI